MKTGQQIEHMAFWKDEEITDGSRLAERFLGLTGRKLYVVRGMKPTTIFNANIFNSDGMRIWFGDVEIDRDRESLLELSTKVGPLYILNEIKSVFFKERLPIPFLRSCAPVVVEGGNILYSKDFVKRVRLLRRLIRPGYTPGLHTKMTCSALPMEVSRERR